MTTYTPEQQDAIAATAEEATEILRASLTVGSEALEWVRIVLDRAQNEESLTEDLYERGTIILARAVIIAMQGEASKQMINETLGGAGLDIEDVVANARLN